MHFCLPLPVIIQEYYFKRTTFKPEYTWHCNPQGLSFPNVTIRKRALLPHDFTLILQSIIISIVRRYCFCDTFCLLHLSKSPAINRCGVLRCPDFPHPAIKRNAIRQSIYIKPKNFYKVSI